MFTVLVLATALTAPANVKTIEYHVKLIPTHQIRGLQGPRETLASIQLQPNRLLGPRLLTAWADFRFELVPFDWELNAYMVRGPIQLVEAVSIRTVGDVWFATIEDKPAPIHTLRGKK